MRLEPIKHDCLFVAGFDYWWFKSLESRHTGLFRVFQIRLTRSEVLGRGTIGQCVNAVFAPFDDSRCDFVYVDESVHSQGTGSEII
jgi:hypothetical protein